jgi:hypothetical protein
VPLTQQTTDIKLQLLNENGSLRVTVNKFRSFEAARREMSELIQKLKIIKLNEWI